MTDNEAVNKTISSRFKELRRHLGLTQILFAEKIGTDQSNIGKMEAGKRPIGMNIEFKILTIFNVNEEWWRNGDREIVKRREARDLASMDPEDVEEVFVTKGGNKHLFNKDGSILMEVPLVTKPA